MTSLMELVQKIDLLKCDLQFIINIINNEEYSEGHRLKTVKTYLETILAKK